MFEGGAHKPIGRVSVIALRSAQAALSEGVAGAEKRTLRTLPDRNLIPAAKWEAYIEVLKRLNELSAIMKRQSALMKRLARCLKSAKKNVRTMEKELVAAVDNGAVIEHGGRLVKGSPC